MTPTHDPDAGTCSSGGRNTDCEDGPNEPVLVTADADESGDASSAYTMDLRSLVRAENNRSDSSIGPFGSCKFNVGTCAQSDHIYPEMLHRHTLVTNAPGTHITRYSGLENTLNALARNPEQPLPRELRDTVACYSSGSWDTDTLDGKIDRRELIVTSGRVSTGLQQNAEDTHQLVTVMRGALHVFLFPPSETRNLYASVVNTGASTCARGPGLQYLP